MRCPDCGHAGPYESFTTEELQAVGYCNCPDCGHTSEDDDFDDTEEEES